MQISLDRDSMSNELAQTVADISGQNVMQCYQCGKCTAGCPLADHMDHPPQQMMRLCQLGDIGSLLSSKAIWLCTSCFQCGTRCPKGIVVHNVVEALRCIVIREGRNRTDIEKLDREVLDAIPQQAIIAAFRKFESLE